MPAYVCVCRNSQLLLLLFPPPLSSSRPLGASDFRSGGAPVHSHGNPFLPRPQTAGGSSCGTKLSKPFPKPQLKSHKPRALQQTCASPTVHTDWYVVNVRELRWFMQYRPGRITVALKQPPWCILTRSGRAIELPRPYSHTCPHLKSAAHVRTHKHTHTHIYSRLNALYGSEPSHEATQHIWLFQSKKLWEVHCRKFRRTSCRSPTMTGCQSERVFHIMSRLRFKMSANVTFVLYDVYRSVCHHGLILPGDASVRGCCSFVCAFDFFLLSCRGDLVSQK